MPDSQIEIQRADGIILNAQWLCFDRNACRDLEEIDPAGDWWSAVVLMSTMVAACCGSDWAGTCVCVCVCECVCVCVCECVCVC